VWPFLNQNRNWYGIAVQQSFVVGLTAQGSPEQQVLQQGFVFVQRFRSGCARSWITLLQRGKHYRIYSDGQHVWPLLCIYRHRQLLELKKLHSYSIEASLPEKPRIDPASERGEASPIPLDLVIFFSGFFGPIALQQQECS
jgi:hypothetical protein